MFKTYLKVGWRNLVRDEGYSFINIGGLALGMTVAILIGLWVHDELSFNKYHDNYDRIAQVYKGESDPGTGVINTRKSLWFPLAGALKSQYPQHFKHVLLAWYIGDCTLSTHDQKLTKKGQFIEAGAPEMLSLKMLKGSYAALNDPHSIILSASAAEAIFGKDDPLNKGLKIDNKMEVIVTGVYEDLPLNNQFGEVKFFAPWTLFVSANQWIKDRENSWDSDSFLIYVQVESNTTIEAVNSSVRDFFFTYAPFKPYVADMKKFNPFITLSPMSKWHLYSEFKDGKPAGGRITFVWLFTIVGAFVLLLACINFVNLSTARSERRAREVGVRKAIGSSRGKLIQQFLSESFMIVGLAFLFSVVLLSLSLDWFNQLADKEITLPFDNISFWATIAIFILITGFMAGLYPAFYLSSFQPVKVLKGIVRLGRHAALPRKVLVVVQFSVSVILIIGTIVVYQQIQHARTRPIGYNRHGLLSVPMNDPTYKGKHEVLKTALLNTGVVSEMALSSSPVTDVWNNGGGFSWKGSDPQEDNNFALCNVTHDFGKTVGWEFIDGRDFSKDFASDSAGIILNETAVKYMGLKNPVGEMVTVSDSRKSWKILGVIKDMIMKSPYDPVKQTIFFLDPKDSASSRINIRIKPTINAGGALPKIEAVFKRIVPSASFDYRFVDEEYALKFRQEERIGQLSGVFAILAIFISCLGLFGLASFVAEQRTKEIGIRKVVGASLFALWKLLSKEFFILVFVSCFIAMPIAYYFMDNWLLRYQYRTEISMDVFAVAVLGALALTLITVSYHAVKAATMNPIKCLRAE
jgi:putative ABC transport system permease protein